MSFESDKIRITDMLHESLVAKTLDGRTFEAPQCYPFYSAMFYHTKAMEAKAYDLEKELYELKAEISVNKVGA